MSKAFKPIARKIIAGKNQGKVMYNARPVSYGVKTEADAARQISAESTVTPADVKAVLDRYAAFVVSSLRDGYDVELLGFGRISLRFKTKECVATMKEVQASQVETVIPSFRPAYRVQNGRRIYQLVPDPIELVKYGEKDGEE